MRRLRRGAAPTPQLRLEFGNPKPSRLPSVPKTTIYKFCSEQIAIVNLAMGRIRSGLLNDQNDPFEMEAHTFPEEDQRRAYLHLMEDRCKVWRMTCASKDYSSPITWAHYADSHRGICLGIEVEEDVALNVVYLGEKKLVDMREVAVLDDHALDQQMTEFFGAKASGWSYENEARVLGDIDALHEEGGRHYFSLNQPDGNFRVKEVILGIHSTIDRSWMRAALDRMGYEDADLKVARKSDTSFHIEAE